MSWRRAGLWLTLFAALAAVGAQCCGRAPGTGEPVVAGRGQEIAAGVTEVVDGDTIHVSIAGRTRDACATSAWTRRRRAARGHPSSASARQPARTTAGSWTAGRVVLSTDAEPRDRYGRLLAYVYRRPDGCS